MTTTSKATVPHAPINFPVIDGELHIGGIPVSRLAERAGGTPFYAYGRVAITHRVASLRAAIPPAVRIHYAIKANPMPALVGYLANLVDGLDIASAGELTTALDAGVAPEHISFAGPGKRTTELRQAVAAGVLLNVESFREARELADISAATGWPARVAVRINPDFELRGAGARMGGGAKPFGVDAEQVPELLREIGALGLAFEGFHIYSGSQNLLAERICEAQTLSVQLALRLAEHAPAPIRVLNIGGGFGIPYFPGEQRLALAPIGDNLARVAAELETCHPDARLVIELGRYLVGEAGVYVCRVIDRKVSRGQVFLVTDGGMHHHLAASGNLGQGIRRNYPVAIGNRMDATATECTTVTGTLCTPFDVLADCVELPQAQPGDLIVVFQSGAYGLTASPTGFLGHPAPAEHLV